MARVSTYLDFPGTTEEAFNFYKSVFGTEFEGELQKFGGSSDSQQQNMSEEDKNKVLHVALPIVGGHVIMGTDATESRGFKVEYGNNMSINLELDSRAEADRIFNALSEGGKISMQMEEAFWEDYFGSFTDRFGINWMVITSSKE